MDRQKESYCNMASGSIQDQDWSAVQLCILIDFRLAVIDHDLRLAIMIVDLWVSGYAFHSRVAVAVLSSLNNASQTP
jgi:hypothetical protein